jgi:Ca-activated chloride channel homolog
MMGIRTVEKTARRLLSLALCTAIFSLFCAASWKDVFRSLPEEAEQAYGQEAYEQALKLYQEAQTRNPDSDTLAYNLGNTLYQLGRYQDAAGQFGRILENDSTKLSSRTIYNMGNSLFEMGRAGGDQQMLNQALEAFKHSIINDPSDEDSKYNYELTHRLIQQQEQQQNQQQQNDDDKKKDDQQQQDQQQQQQDQDQEQNQEQQDKQQQNEEQQKEQENKPDQQQQQEQEQEQQQQPQPQPGEMSEEEAEKILQALMQMEKDAQEKEQKQKVPTVGSKGRDW